MSSAVISIIVIVSYLLIGAVWAVFVAQSEYNAKIKARRRSGLSVNPEIRDQIFNESVEGTGLLLLAWPLMIAFAVTEGVLWIVRKIVMRD